MMEQVPMHWNFEKMANLVKIKTGNKDANASSEDGIYPFFTCADKPLKINSFCYDGKSILLAGNGDLSNIFIYNGAFDAYQRTYYLYDFNAKLDYKYLFYHLKSNWVKYNQNKQFGSVMSYIKMANLTEYPVIYPSLLQQEKIVSVLDTASALVEKQKILLEKYDLFLKSKFIEMFGDPVKNPMGWETEIFKNVLHSIESGWSPNCYEEATKKEGEWGVLKLSALSKNQYEMKANKKLRDEYLPKESLEVKRGDLLFSRKNTYELVGSIAYVFNTKSNLMLPDLIFRLLLKEEVVNKIFVWKLFSNSNFIMQIRALASGSSGSMPNISKGKLSNLMLPIPPIELQTQFAQIVEQTEILKQKEQQKLEKLQTLYDALMKRAFDGEIG